jgi:hypothetical protein
MESMLAWVCISNTAWNLEDDRTTWFRTDWDINAKLPHGVEGVRHLKEVDNLPLLVSLYGCNQGDNKGCFVPLANFTSTPIL